MADASEKTAAVETVTKEPAAGTETPPVTADPYAGLDPETAEAAREADEMLRNWNPATRAQVVRLAFAKSDEIRKAQEAAKAGTPKPKTEDASDDDDPLKKVTARLESIQKKLEDREESDRQRQLEAERKATAAKFTSDVRDALKAAGVESEDMDDLEEAYLGHFIKHRPTDIAGSVKRFVEKQEHRVEKVAATKGVEWVKAKIAARKAVKGETKGGNAPSKEEPKASAERWDSGKTLDDLRKKYATKE